MTDIGVMPTKTSLQIKSSSGEGGTIPAATAANAGAMTAEHVKMLEAVYEALMRGGIDPVTIIAPPVDTSNMVTRAELQAVVNRLAATPAQVVIEAPAPQMVTIPAPIPVPVRQSETVRSDERALVRRTEAAVPVMAPPEAGDSHGVTRSPQAPGPEQETGDFLQASSPPRRHMPMDLEGRREATIEAIAMIAEEHEHAVPVDHRDDWHRTLGNCAADAKASMTIAGVDSALARAEAFITGGR